MQIKERSEKWVTEFGKEYYENHFAKESLIKETAVGS